MVTNGETTWERVEQDGLALPPNAKAQRRWGRGGKYA